MELNEDMVAIAKMIGIDPKKLANAQQGKKMAREQTVVVGKVERMGNALIVPEEMSLENAKTVIEQQMEYEDTTVERGANFDAHPYDVAHAFGRAIEAVCGTKLGKPMRSFFGSEPPREIAVEVAPNQFVKVLWGAIVFPFDPKNGQFMTHWTRKSDGTVIGMALGKFKQKYEPVWTEIITLTRSILDTESIFKGKTLRVKFLDNDGDMLQVPDIKAWDVSKVNVAHLTFSKGLEASIEDHILTPIRHKAATDAAGIPFKRGVLLAGPYGTGKTLLAAHVAREASQRGITVLYIENVKELPHALRMAAQLAPSVVFAEDVDRVTDGNRTHEVDVLLNTLDGIDTKTYDIMTILTTNYAGKIYKGLVRPGRIDVALEVLPPDAEAAVRLVKAYLGEMFTDEGANLDSLGDSLAGHIPAVIREVCERAKLSYISRTGEKPAAQTIRASDVMRAAGSMKNQIALLNAEDSTEQTEAEKMGAAFRTLFDAVAVAADPRTREAVEYIRE